MRDAFVILLDRVECLVAEAHSARARAESAEGRLADMERTAQPPRPDPVVVVALVNALATEGRKIEAIRYYRELTGHGLKESKDAIETVTCRFAGV